MKKLFFVFLLIFSFACSKDVFTDPSKDNEIIEFDLFVKNPNNDAAAIYLYSDLVGNAESFCHKKIGTFACSPENIHLEAHFSTTTIVKDVSTEHWRKPSYTFYLPEL